MRAGLVVLCLWSAVALATAPAAQTSPEVSLALLSLRGGERARLEKVAGPIEDLPLYRAQLELDPDKRTVTGKVFITVLATSAPLAELYLRVNANAHDARVKLSHANLNGAPAVLEQPERHLFRVKIDPPALPGVGAAIDLKLSAKIPAASADSDSLAVGATSRSRDYGAFSAAPEIVTLTGLLPGVAPRGTDGELTQGPGGVGDPGDFAPANWLIGVVAPSGWNVIAPGHALGEVPEPGGRSRFTFAIAGARDFVVLATRGYQVATAKVDDITVESHYLAEDKDAGKRALKYATDSLTDLQRRLGPYPWTGLRLVEARLTGGAGGMEFPGLFTVSTALYRGTTDPLAALGMPGVGQLPMLQSMTAGLKPLLESTVEFTVAHEVAHQWFAMTIGSDPVEEPVVDEPLAQHAALLYLEAKRGKAVADGMRDAQLKGSYHLMRMMGGKDAAAHRPTREFDSNNEYAALVYGKAPLFYDQARKLVGDEKHFKALRAYCDEHRWGTARPDSFTRVLGKLAPAHLKALEKLRARWWDEAKGDEDLGKPDFGAMFGGVGAKGPKTDALDALDPSTARMLEEAIRALQGE